MSSTSLEDRIRTRAISSDATELEKRLDDVTQWLAMHANERMDPEHFVLFATRVLLNLLDLHLMTTLAMGDEQSKRAHERFTGLVLPVGQNMMVRERRAG